MTLPDYGLWALIGFGALGLFTLFALGRALLGRMRMAAGMRFPVGDRAAGIKPGLRARLVHMPMGLRAITLVLLLAAALRPQMAQEDTAEVEGIDIVVAFDMSGSMAAADISKQELVELQNKGKNPKDRFTAATEVLRNFITSRKYDRVSLVVFGKEAFLQFPLTLDYGVMLRILDQMTLKDIDGNGTVIGNALAMSLARLKESEAKTKLVILLTDGEDNNSKVAPMEMAKEAAKRGVRVFTILVGSEDQSWEPSGMDLFTGQSTWRPADNKVNPKLLQDIADATDGRFYRATDQKKLKKDFQDILDEFEKSRLVDYAAAQRTEIFTWFLLPALLLLLLEILLSQTWLRRFP